MSSLPVEDQSLLQEPKTESPEDTSEMVVSVYNSEHGASQPVKMEESPDPPFEMAYRNLFKNLTETVQKNSTERPVVEECELPLIDLKQLGLGDAERQACKKLIAQASQEWGFFLVINHGIPTDVLETMRAEQMKLLRKPFHEKETYEDLNFSAGSYRWGTTSANSVEQLSWSEAFHVLLSDILGSGGSNSLSSSMEKFAIAVNELAQQLSEILAGEMGHQTGLFKEKCLPSSCYLRLNRYPPCPLYSQTMGIIPHTDSDFLTVLHQDNVGGLQLVKDGKWYAVKPNPEALVINIGDLFQAWSNNLYKSVEHRVLANPLKERFSTAYFFCPSFDTVIQSGAAENCAYRSFSFGEYKKQIAQDVQILGQKIGLQRFLVPSH